MTNDHAELNGVLVSSSDTKQNITKRSRKRSTGMTQNNDLDVNVDVDVENNHHATSKAKRAKTGKQMTLDSLGWFSEKAAKKSVADVHDDVVDAKIESSVHPVSSDSESTNSPAEKSTSTLTKSNGKHNKSQKVSVDSAQNKSSSKAKTTTYFSRTVEIPEPEDLPWADDDTKNNDNNHENDHENDHNTKSDFPSNRLEDDPRIPQIVMFQRQFHELFYDVPALGPQDIEQGISEQGSLSYNVEALMVRLMSLLLNRKKKMIEPGRYKRSLEEVGAYARSVGGFGANWPQGYNIKHGVEQLEPTTKLEYLRLLTVWALSNSQDVRALINSESFKSLGPDKLGRDAKGNTYWLVQGIRTPFRVYKESFPRLKKVSWTSVAGTVEELHGLKQSLEKSLEDGLHNKNANKRKSRNKHELQQSPEYKTECALIASIEDKIEQLVLEQSQREKDLAKEEMLRDAELALERARNGEGRYSGRTRGVKVNYFVDYTENDDFMGYENGEADAEGAGNGDGEEDEFYEEHHVQADTSLRGSRWSSRLRASHS